MPTKSSSQLMILLAGLTTAEEERQALEFDSSGDDEPVFSLADGRYHAQTRMGSKKKASASGAEEGAVVLREQDLRLEKASAFKAMSAAGESHDVRRLWPR